MKTGKTKTGSRNDINSMRWFMINLADNNAKTVRKVRTEDNSVHVVFEKCK